MKNLRLIMLLLVFSPFVMAQSPLTDLEHVILNENRLIETEILKISYPEFATSEKSSQTASINLENYLSLKGIKSKIKKEDKGTVTSLTSEDLMGAGIHHLDLSSKLALGTYKNKTDGEDDGNTGSRNFNIRGGTNIVNGFGVRAIVLLDGSTYKPETGNGEEKIRENFVRVELVKPFMIANQVINAHAGYGIGVDKTIIQSGGMEIEYKDDIANIQIGFAAPINIGEGAVYFNPMICLSNTVWDYDGGKSTYNAIELESNIYSYFNCGMFDPCNKGGLNLSQGHYLQGSSCVGSNTGINFELGTEKNEQDGIPNDQESNNTHYGLSVDYSYFVTDNIAVRGLLDYAGETVKDKDTDFKRTNSNIWAGAGVVFHPPLEGNLINTYAHAEFQVGKDKQKYEGGSTFENDENVTMIGLGVGYNLFVLPGVAFSPEINYTLFKQKNKDADTENDLNGISLGFGFKSFF